MFCKRIPKVTLCCLLFIHIQGSGYTARETYDQTSTRTNTLLDDADDIQRQLDNEAKDRIKYGRPKTIWVFHFPTHTPDHNSIMNPLEWQLARFPRHDFMKNAYEEDSVTPPMPPYREWDYANQNDWPKLFPTCGGKSQSPVDLPNSGLIKARGSRKMLFRNYDVVPKTMSLMNDGKRVVLFGEWRDDQRPLIYGGAAHSRRYLFHSLTVHLPSEHSVGGVKYPVESQAFYISAEYGTLNKALDASPSDPQAFLGISSLYQYSNRSHRGLEELLAMAKTMGYRNATLITRPLKHYNPPLKEYASYQGSITHPPCTESVLWLVRGRTLSIMRETVENYQAVLAANTEARNFFFRTAQPLNDRRVYLFK